MLWRKAAEPMKAYFPDAKVIRTVLALASRAPSIYNSQPWRWRVGDDALHLYVEPSLQLPYTDPSGRDLILSCGAALNHCVIALAAMGWRARVHRLPNPANTNHLATIAVDPANADQADVMLAAAIPQRRTDRRHYSSWPVAAGDIAQMTARAARMGILLRRVDAVDTLNQIVARAVRSHAMNYEYLAEITRWSGRYGSVAGIPARNIPEHDCAAPIPGRIFAGPALAQPLGASPAEDSAVILVLGTETDDRLAWLRAGEATSAVLLTATAMGLASCPVTEPLEIAETREAVRSDVFGTSGYPQMLLRVGWALVNADPLPPTPRRQLSDVVEWSIESEAKIFA
ncbi:putative NAD(P)H nitroreductase acg [Mycobacterium heckeshornense]|uniref:Putative NAD(P)H nitroreductase n=2 Tax=Mycobacterium heckeshornense TaxID=110505 RepID=A0A7R7YSA9_9MYCO|nr:putative NAD(P)H nitroreductase [Mycobacterium heckeshornense]BCQ09555.1 putative NAD(P)H nitroreductase acg [Mycobacterium heckeshornense]